MQGTTGYVDSVPAKSIGAKILDMKAPNTYTRTHKHTQLLKTSLMARNLSSRWVLFQRLGWDINVAFCLLNPPHCPWCVFVLYVWDTCSCECTIVYISIQMTSKKWSDHNVIKHTHLPDGNWIYSEPHLPGHGPSYITTEQHILDTTKQSANFTPPRRASAFHLCFG